MAYKRLLKSLQSLSIEAQTLLFLCLEDINQCLEDINLIYEDFVPYTQDLDFLIDKVVGGYHSQAELEPYVQLLYKDLEMLCGLNEKYKSSRNSSDYDLTLRSIKELLHIIRSKSPQEITVALSTVEFHYGMFSMPVLQAIAEEAMGKVVQEWNSQF